MPIVDNQWDTKSNVEAEGAIAGRRRHDLSEAMNRPAQHVEGPLARIRGRRTDVILGATPHFSAQDVPQLGLVPERLVPELRQGHGTPTQMTPPSARTRAAMAARSTGTSRPK